MLKAQDISYCLFRRPDQTSIFGFNSTSLRVRLREISRSEKNAKY